MLDRAEMLALANDARITVVAVDPTEMGQA
jgi:hypothetical protein